MKKCPSCNAQCEDEADLCPVCGYSFSEGVAAGKPKRTMMGFPSISAGDDEEEQAEPTQNPKNTLFGFPANEEEKASGDHEPDPPSTQDDDDAYAATSIIPASEFNFEDDVPPAPADQSDELRGTMAGRPAPESEDDDKTEVVPGTALFPGRAVDQSAEEQEEDEDEEPHRGTLLGMSLQDVESLSNQKADSANEGIRSTQFAIPAVQGEDEGDEELEETVQQTIKESDLSGDQPATDDEDEEQFDDAPTQAWNPETASLKDKFDPEGRKKLLEKIRKSRPGGTRDTSQGVPAAKGPDSSSSAGQPDLSALKKLRPKRELAPTPSEFPEDERETQEHEKAERPSGTPESGVVRAPSRPASSQTEKEKRENAPGGASSYMLGPGQAKKDGPKKGVPIGQIGASRKQEQPSGVGDGLSDPEFATAETDIASGDLLREAGVLSQGQGDQPDAKVSAFDETMAGGRISQEQLDRPSPPGGPSSHIDGPTSPSGPTRPPVQQSSPRGTQQQFTPHGQNPQGQNSQGQNPQGQPPPPAQQPFQPQGQQQFQPQGQPGQQGLRPNQPSDRFTPSQQRTEQPNIYETFDGGPSSAPQNQQMVPANPTGGMKKSSAPGEDPLVRTIQSLFGIIAGAITLIVQVVVLLDGFPESTMATIVVALALTMGLAAIVAALAPVSMKLRSVGLFAVGGAIGLAFILGFLVAVPSTFLVVALGAFVAIMAAAFPIIARHLL